MQRKNFNRTKRVAALLCGVSVSLILIVLCHIAGGSHYGSMAQRAFAAEVTLQSTAQGDSDSSNTNRSSIIVDYPEEGSIFPPEIGPPTFLWRDSDESAKTWQIDINFSDGFQPLKLTTSGDHMRIGEIDPRCISENNRPPALTPQQAADHTWIPDGRTWTIIKQHSVDSAVTIVITGLSGDDPGNPVSTGRVNLSTSRDPVGAPIFYRDVPLMPSAGAKGVVQPLAPDAVHLINWRLRDISQPQSRVVLHDMPTCANCHSFSADGKTMGIDVDGPANDKGLYAVVPIRPVTVIRNEDMLAWNSDATVGKSRVGFMSQVSPDGRYVLTTFAGPQHDLPDTYYVTNFKDYRFLQVFFPTRGILVWYNRATGRRQPLPGAADPQYVQTDGVWSPDGKYIVFARARAKDPRSEGQKPALRANDENETQIQYDLYRIPFNDGRGGTPEPIEGASQDGMSNNFPKVSPDGRWIVFVKCRNGQLMRPDSQLYIVPVTGGVARRMRCNTSLMNSWHSFSPNSRWLVFSSKSRSPYTQMFLTHIDEKGQDSPAIYVENSTAANRAVNIPEFVNISSNMMQKIAVPVVDFYQVIDHASALLEQGKNTDALLEWQRAVSMQPDDVRAQNGLAIAFYMKGDFNQAAAHFLRANQINPSSLADARANCYLGLMYRDGHGVPQDSAKAVKLLLQAANRGYAPAQYYLGAVYSSGQGVPRDYDISLNLYRAAAEQGNADAQNALGLMYRDGEGVAQDFAQAMDWFRKAAEQGEAQAQFNLGQMYESGQGVSQDSIQAMAWFRKAAEHGSANAELIVGIMYRTGRGVAQDDVQAVEWLRKAAEQGSAQAEYYLGTMYGNGQGVAQDLSASEEWYLKAADQGSANAQFILGVKYFSGQGIKQDYAEAYYLLNLANSCTRDEKNKPTIAQALDYAAHAIDTDQLTLQQERAQKWLKSHSCQ